MRRLLSQFKVLLYYQYCDSFPPISRRSLFGARGATSVIYHSQQQRCGARKKHTEAKGIKMEHHACVPAARETCLSYASTMAYVKKAAIGARALLFFSQRGSLGQQRERHATHNRHPIYFLAPHPTIVSSCPLLLSNAMHANGGIVHQPQRHRCTSFWGRHTMTNQTKPGPYTDTG